MLLVFGFGWAKPVPVNFANITQSRGGLILVSSAGIVVNMMMAFAMIFLLRFHPCTQTKVLSAMLYYMAQINCSGGVQPDSIPPLDGIKF